MYKFFAAAALVLVAQGAAVRAGDPSPFGGTPLFPLINNTPTAPGMKIRTAHLHTQTGAPAATVTRLQPVVGSIHQTNHFTNPFTHKSKYTSTVYNPALGTFGTRKFKQ